MKQIKFEDFKIEDIRGGIAFDAVQDFQTRLAALARKIRELGARFREAHDWRSPLSVEIVNPFQPAELEKIPGMKEETEQMRLAAALALNKRQPGLDSSLLAITSLDPRFQIMVDVDSCNFIFDAVEVTENARVVLEAIIRTILEGFSLADVKTFAIEFRHIFLLKRNLKNFSVLGTILPGVNSHEGFYGSFGKDREIGRVDLSWVIARKESGLITRVKLEAPGNDDNTTLWLSAKTQTSSEIVGVDRLNGLASYFAFYKGIVMALLTEVLRQDDLDLTRREMMVKNWFVLEEESK